MTTNIMLDLETMGNSSNAAITAIGACVFGADGIGKTFYAKVDLESAVDMGGKMDASTVVWWLKQNPAAQAEMTKPGVRLNIALLDFTAFCLDNSADRNDLRMWGNGAAFDNVILGNAYEGTCLARPWDFWNDRCFRTIKALHKDVPAPTEAMVKHHALYDAIAQANHLIKIAGAKGITL